MAGSGQPLTDLINITKLLSQMGKQIDFPCVFFHPADANEVCEGCVMYCAEAEQPIYDAELAHGESI